MAVVRTLVDGYSLLHQWPELAPGKPRQSQVAREELINHLTQYYDQCGTPITVVFDGQGPRNDLGPFPSTPEVEIIYTRAARSADQLIEHLVHRLKPHGDVLVVTDDYAERETIESLGGLFSSCANFVQTVKAALADLTQEIAKYNQQEQLKFRSH